MSCLGNSLKLSYDSKNSRPGPDRKTGIIVHIIKILINVEEKVTSTKGFLIPPYVGFLKIRFDNYSMCLIKLHVGFISWLCM